MPPLATHRASVRSPPEPATPGKPYPAAERRRPMKPRTRDAAAATGQSLYPNDQYLRRRGMAAHSASARLTYDRVVPVGSVGATPSGFRQISHPLVTSAGQENGPLERHAWHVRGQIHAHRQSVRCGPAARQRQPSGMLSDRQSPPANRAWRPAIRGRRPCARHDGLGPAQPKIAPGKNSA